MLRIETVLSACALLERVEEKGTTSVTVAEDRLNDFRSLMFLMGQALGMGVLVFSYDQERNILYVKKDKQEQGAAA